MMDENVLNLVLCVTVKPDNAKKMRCTLSQLGIIDKSKKAMKCDDVVAIPIRDGAFKRLTDVTADVGTNHAQLTRESMTCVCLSCARTFDSQTATSNRADTCRCVQHRCSGIMDGVKFHAALIPQKNLKKKRLSPSQRLQEVLSKILTNKKITINDAIKADFPKNWEVHGDLILVPSQSLAGDVWKRLKVEDWQEVMAAVGGKRLARSVGAIQRDGFRTPNVEVLLGDSGWAEHVDNGIRYGFDVTKCMFSSGNITEKIRVANMKCDGETVVDLYAGIGYFTLPYLVHANAAYVHACEWNPNAVDALKRNLVLNKVEDRCTVYEGDNRQTCPVGVADRVNLGLIPTSTAGWPVACQALKSTGGLLHVHGNVTTPVSGKHCASLSNSSSAPANRAHASPGCVSQGDASLASCVLESGSTDMDKLTDKTSPSNVSQSDVSEHKSLLSCTDIDTPAGQTSPSSVSHTDTQADNTLLSCRTDSDTPADKTSLSCRTDSDTPADKRSPSSVLNKASTDVVNDQTLEVNITHSHMVSNHKSSRQESWNNWACKVSQQIKQLCIDIKGGNWTTRVLHIERVKSYAPHIDHVVVDLECTPCI